MGLNIEGSIFTKGINVGKLFMKSAMHGLSRGIISVAQGGTFKSGFASGFSASFFSPGTTMGGDGAGGFGLRTSIAAVVGGTASAIGGGKFSNGAVSGAFVHMFNAEARAYSSKDKMLNVAESKWKMGDKGMYKTLIVNGADTGKISAFSAYGPSAADKFFSGLGNGVVSGVHFIGDHGDGIGLALSVGAMATPGGWGYLMGVSAIGIDIAQGDMLGAGIGGVAMTPIPGAGVLDIGYGISQL